jgi:hypothetical protein
LVGPEVPFAKVSTGIVSGLRKAGENSSTSTSWYARGDGIVVFADGRVVPAYNGRTDDVTGGRVEANRKWAEVVNLRSGPAQRLPHPLWWLEGCVPPS